MAPSPTLPFLQVDWTHAIVMGEWRMGELVLLALLTLLPGLAELVVVVEALVLIKYLLFIDVDGAADGGVRSRVLT